MKTIHIGLLMLLFAVAAKLSAQVPTYRQTLDELAKADADAPVIIADGVIKASQGTLQEYLQRGILLYAAAGRARECNNVPRIPALATAAREALLAAEAHLSGASNSQKSQCEYYLGLIEEKYNGNVTLAAAYYTKAVAYQSDNSAAQTALNRIKQVPQN